MSNSLPKFFSGSVGMRFCSGVFYVERCFVVAFGLLLKRNYCGSN